MCHDGKKLQNTKDIISRIEGPNTPPLETDNENTSPYEGGLPQSFTRTIINQKFRKKRKTR